MLTRLLRSALIAAGLLTLAASPAAAWCDMHDYNRADPPSPISDVIDGYPDVRLEWGSDVDRYQGGERAFDYVRNLHERNVAVLWEKTGILVPFYKGLPKGKTACQKHSFGNVGTLVRSDDAPIKINSYGDSPASAYLPKGNAGQLQDTSVRLEAGYIEDGKDISAFAEVSFYFSPDHSTVKMVVKYGPPEAGVLISNKTFDLTEAMVKSLAGPARYEMGRLNTLVAMDGQTRKWLGNVLANPYFKLQGLGEHIIAFEVRGIKRAAMPMMLVDPHGNLIAAGKIYFGAASESQPK